MCRDMHLCDSDYVFSGTCVQLGKRLQVLTPTHDFLLRILVPQERKARGELMYTAIG
jgi:hypothetical protein